VTLVVPDPRHEPVPPGWWDQYAKPLIDVGDDDWLDEAERRVRAIVELLDVAAHGADMAQLRAVWRCIERRRGERLLDQSHYGAGRRPAEEMVHAGAPFTRTQLKWRAIAAHWDALIYPYLVEQTASENPNPARLTQAIVLAKIREDTPAAPDATLPDYEGEDGLALLHGDFRDRLRELGNGTVDLIITDPPYPADALSLWSDLAKEAARLLGPRGLLFAWAGQIFLPEVLARLGEHLTYGWTFAFVMNPGGSRIFGRHVVQVWKPVVAFSTGTWPSGEWSSDVLYSPEPEKDEYAWQQTVVPARYVIEHFAPGNGLVVDPFLGAGTFGVAARNAGRRFVGVELDAARFALAERRIRSSP
jgi:hypothetical protein